MIFMVHLNTFLTISVGVTLTSSCVVRAYHRGAAVRICRDLALPTSAELIPPLLLTHCREGHD